MKLYIEKELINMPDFAFPIKTYVIDSKSINLAASPHIHEEIELIYVIKGSMHFYFNGKRLTVDKGKIIFINSLTVHSSSLATTDETQMCLLQFNPSMIYNVDNLSEFKYLTPFIQHGSTPYYLMDTKISDKHKLLANYMMEAVKEFESKGIAYEISIKSLLYGILTILYRNGTLPFNAINNIRKEKEMLHKLEKVLYYVENNYAGDITVEDACSIANLNYHYFCRLFKATTGKSFIQYLNFVRISVAEKLMLTTDMPVTEIILHTGFSSISYFNRMFKKLKGSCPTDYRKGNSS